MSISDLVMSEMESVGVVPSPAEDLSESPPVQQDPAPSPLLESSPRPDRCSSLGQASQPPPASDFRSVILDRLQHRNAKCRQFESVFSSFTDVLETMQRLRLQRVRTESVGSCSTNDGQLEALRAELADVYKKKSINDQHLLESNRSLDDMRKKLDTVTKEKAELTAVRDKLYARVADLEIQLHRSEEDKNNARDEYVALSANFHALSEKVQQYEAERINLLEKIRVLQEKEAALFNSELEKHNQKNAERIRAQIEAALNEVPNGYEQLVPLGEDAVEAIGDVVPDTCMNKFEANEGEVTSLAWLGSEMFATGGSDKVVRVYRVTPRGQVDKISSLVGCNQTVTRLDWNGEKREVLASSNDYTARIWKVDTGRLQTTFSGHTEKVSSARFLQTEQIVTGSFDRTLKLFDQSGKAIRSFFPGSSVLDVGALGTSFISGHMDKKVRIWDGRKPEPVRTIEMGGRVTSVDVAYDQRTFVCSMRDDTLAMVDLRNYGVLHIYGAEQYRTSSDMSRCVLSPLQEYVAAGSAEGTIFIWRASSTKLETRLSKRGHDIAVQALAWNPNGRGLLSSDRQKTVCLWL